MSSRERLERRRVRCGRPRRRRLVAEALEDRRLLAVAFEFNYLAGNQIGFNHPTEGDGYRTALQSAADRLGSWILDTATVQIDVTSSDFNGTAVAIAASELSLGAGGGFFHPVIPGKIVGQGDVNGADADGGLEVYFFDQSDPFTYVTDPAQAGDDDEIDFQAVIIHELVHSLGFTTAISASGSDLSGNGITTPGSWTPYDQFVSDVDGNRLIDGDPSSPTAFQMDTSATGWPLHSVGGKGPDGGLFFDGPIATAVYGGRVPLYSPSPFAFASSVSHLDSEGFPAESSVFSPLTHLMSHGIVDAAAPQELTLVEKAILADLGLRMSEDESPIVTAPEDLIIEADSTGGFAGSDQRIDDFLAAAAADDLFDPNPLISDDLPAFLPVGRNPIVFTATDQSGNTGSATAFIEVVDTIAPTLSVTPVAATFEATGPEGVTVVSLPFEATVSDIVEPDPVVSFAPHGIYPLGVTTVTYSAEDAAGNFSTFDVDVFVEDTTAPNFTLPATLTIDANLADGADLSNPELIQRVLAEATDLVDPTLSVSADASFFPIGVSSVTFTVADDDGNQASASTQLTVQSRLAVTTLDDELDADPASNPDDVSLREAISLADARSGADFVYFDASLSGSILLDASLGQLSISDAVTLVGPGAEVITVDAQQNSRVFAVAGSAGDVTLSGLTIRGGRLSGDDETGAGVRSFTSGTLTIDQAVVSDNVTTGSRGGGSGVHHPSGPLVVVDSMISGNRAEGDTSPGGGVFSGGGQATVTRSAFVGNSTTAADSPGGGLYLAQSPATIRESSFTNNTTAGGESSGGAIHAAASSLQLVDSMISANSAGMNSNGGGIFVLRSDLGIDRSSITNNTAGRSGGGIAVDVGDQDVSLNIHNSIVDTDSDSEKAIDYALLVDYESWRIGAPIVVGDRFLLTANNSLGGGDQSIEADLPAPWRNFVNPSDINNDGDVTARDALRILNEMGRREYSHRETGDLQDPLTVANWPGDYMDQNGDNKVTALDALRVLNEFARQRDALLGEGESGGALLGSDTNDASRSQPPANGQLVGRDVERATPATGSADEAAAPRSHRHDDVAIGASGAASESAAVDELLADQSFLEKLV